MQPQESSAASERAPGLQFPCDARPTGTFTDQALNVKSPAKENVLDTLEQRRPLFRLMTESPQRPQSKG